jgi:uncharacterized lipoprotein YmbA
MKTTLPQALMILTGACLAAFAGLGAGCSLPAAQADATRYYVLTTAGTPAPAVPAGPHWRVALRPVDVPSYLRGKAMAVRVGGNEIQYADDYRWAESLEAGIGRVLRESLEGRGEIAHVVASTGEDHDFDISVRVLNCEGDRTTGVARFTAVVEIHAAGPGAARRARDTFTLEVPGWDRRDYGQLAQKLSQAVDELGDRIVTLLATPDKP